MLIRNVMAIHPVVVQVWTKVVDGHNRQTDIAIPRAMLLTWLIKTGVNAQKKGERSIYLLI